MPQVRQAEAETAENAEVKEIFSRAAVHFDCKDRYSAEERERLNSIERTYISLKMGSNDLNINGNSVKMDAEPRYAEEKTMIPIRIVAEALGAKVDWDEAAQSVIVCDENTRICIPLSSYYAVIDNAWALDLGASAFIAGGRTYVPLRVIAETLGAEVWWESRTMTITIQK